MLEVVQSDPEVHVAFKKAISIIQSLGATIVDDVDFEQWVPSGGLREDLFGDVMLREGGFTPMALF